MQSPIWQDMFALGVPILEKIVRPVIVYVFLVVGLRLAGKRELAQLNAFDLVVLLTLSNTVQNAIIGNDNSVVGGLFGAAVLLLANHFLVRYLFKSGRLDRVEGSPDVLIANGRILRDRLDKEMITLPELEAAARKQGINSVAEIKECRLETGGALTFVTRVPTVEEAKHGDLMQRLDAIERKVAGITARE
jgi:uncharacterized membrane protein YcaP (DUF421 family)